MGAFAAAENSGAHVRSSLFDVRDQIDGGLAPINACIVDGSHLPWIAVGFLRSSRNSPIPRTTSTALLDLEADILDVGEPTRHGLGFDETIREGSLLSPPWPLPTMDSAP